jgi:hypothetical protein
MSSTELTVSERRDPIGGGTDIRDSLERSVAEHKAVDVASREPQEARPDRPRSPRRRTEQIRDAIREVETQHARETGQNPDGPPPYLSADAKKAWPTVHPSVRKSILQRDDHLRIEIGKVARQYGELENTLAPWRPHLAAAGLKSDAHAVSTLLAWVRALSDPNSNVQAFRTLAAHHNIQLEQLGIEHGTLINRLTQMQDMLETQHRERVALEAQQSRAEVAKWERGKQGLTQEVREATAHFLRASADMGRPVDLDTAYSMALAHLGIPEKQAREAEGKRRASVSPKGGGGPVRGSTPAKPARRPSAIRDTIVESFRASRETRL